MSSAPTMSAGVVRAALDAAERLGVDRAAVARRVGVAETDLSDPDGRVSMDVAVRLGVVLREMLGPTSPIRLAEVIAQSQPTVLDYLVEHCRDLGQVYRTIQRYRAIVMEITPPALETTADEARFGCVYPDPFVVHAPGIVELRLAFWLLKGRNVTGVDWTPRAIYLQSPETDRATYERVFRCPVYNDADQTRLVFDAALLETTVTHADTQLHHYLKQIADEVVSRLPQRQGFRHTVQACIARILKEGDSHLESVARELNVSTRTLQRRLEEEGTTFAALLDEARRTAALEYLKDRRISIADTAILVGFSEPSTFYRAFKRWTGTTPASWRRGAYA